MNKPIHEQLQDVFRTVFGNPNLIISENTTAENIKGWDSFMHIQLIAAIESRFAIKFTFNEVIQFKNIGDMLAVIEKKRNG